MSGNSPRVTDGSLLTGVRQSEIRLGEGSYGVVFLGSWHGRKVAIKRFHPIHMGLDRTTGRPNPAFVRFIREHETLRPISHPSIVQVFGWIHPYGDGISHGLVMEYLPLTVKERYRSQPPLDKRQHVLVMLSVASGLEYLHKHALIHRDLTTSNIMMTVGAGSGPEDGQCKITDVGVATALKDASREEQTMSPTPGAERYMAPETRDEQGDGWAKYGPKADNFSLGVAVMAMINKREPPNIYSLARNGRKNDIDDIPDDHPLQPFVLRCIADNHEQRPAASELCRELTIIYDALPAPPAEATEATALQQELHEVKEKNAQLQGVLEKIGDLSRTMR